MTPQNAPAVGDFGRTLPRLRRDLVVCPRTAGGETFYLMEDPANSEFYRVGVAEYRFISLLDGQTPVHEALRLAAQSDPEHAISEQESTSVCKWLLDSELLEPSGTLGPASHKNEPSTKPKKSTSAWNPLFTRIPLGVPDALFARLTAWFGWLFSPLAYVAWLAVMLVAGIAMLQNWPRVVTSTSVLLARDNWLWLGASWLLLKIAHECAHGIVCKLRGGYVRETGVLFILLMPAAYVDVTSAWSFRSKWRRIETAAAGMYVETWLAAAAALAWCYLPQGVLSHVLLNVVALAGVTTVAVNINPLIRFDGYYMLSDLVEVPNLYQRSQQVAIQFLRRLLSGKAEPTEASTLRRWLLGLYGAASLVWRFAFCVGLLIAAAMLFEGAGIVLAATALATWTVGPTARFLKVLFSSDPGQSISKTRLGLIVGMPCLAVAILVVACPWPGACSAPAIVEFAPLAIVRSEAAGFIDQLRVRDGQLVQAGDLLVVLRNESLAAEAADLRLALQQSQIQWRIHQQKGAIAACQAERSKSEGLSTRLREKEAELARLEVRAPIAGTVMAPDLATKADAFVHVGDEILSIGSEDQKEIRLAVSDDQFSEFAQHLDGPTWVRLPGGQWLDCRLAKIEPRASRTPPHPAFSAQASGPLAMRPCPRAASERNEETDRSPKRTNEPPSASTELLEPRFLGVVELTTIQSRSVRAGQLGVASFRPFEESIARYLWTYLASSFRRRSQ